MNLLEIRDVSIRVATRTLCTNLSLRMQTGENWAILGANGSGKTSLLHTLAGLRLPTAGEVRLDGRNVRALRPRERALCLALLPQGETVPAATRVHEAVLIGRYPHLAPWDSEQSADRARVQEALAAVDLAAFESRELTTLSGGEQRRVAIARLLVQSAPIRLLDEPTNHLDLGHQIRILTLLSRPAVTTLNVFVLHDINLAARFCSHGLLLFGNGDHRHGPLSTLLDPTVLSHLYGCRINQIETEQGPLFVPD